MKTLAKQVRKPDIGWVLTSGQEAGECFLLQDSSPQASNKPLLFRCQVTVATTQCRVPEKLSRRPHGIFYCPCFLAMWFAGQIYFEPVESMLQNGSNTPSSPPTEPYSRVCVRGRFPMPLLQPHASQEWTSSRWQGCMLLQSDASLNRTSFSWHQASMQAAPIE